MASLYQQHVEKWKNCKLCPLCETRNRVVLARGELPAAVMFIGEAPGASENVLGQPFVGPAGQLLDDIINDAVRQAGIERPRIAFTNLIACIPKGDDGTKVKEPSEESIQACSPRLDEIFLMCSPRLIVYVGKLPEKHLQHYRGGGTNAVGIVHPAAILRADITQRGLLTQRARVILTDALEDLAG